MASGPVEVIVVGFPGSQFTGGILPQLEALVENDIITVIDGLLLTKDPDGEVSFLELEQVEGDAVASAFAAMVGSDTGLLSDEDIEEFAAAVEPGSSAAVLAFEHTWVKGLRDEIVNSGGQLVANVRIPGAVVDEVLLAVHALEEEENADA